MAKDMIPTDDTRDAQDLTAPISLGHWGAFRAHVKGGRLERAVPLGGADPQMVGAWPELVHSPLRIARPHVRRGWLENGPGPTPDRGRDEMVPVDWDTALDLAAREIARVQRDHGPTAILGGSYGWSSAGRLHHARSQVRRFLAAAGGFTDQVTNYSWGAAAVILPHVLGNTDAVAFASTSWESIAEHSDAVVAFGGLNPKNWRVTSGGAVDHPLPGLVAQAQARGCRFTVISPLAQDVPPGLEAALIQPRPGSDTAIMLALAHEAWVSGRADRDFLNRYTTGADRLVAYLSGATDGVPKTLSWAAEQADVPLSALEDLWQTIRTGRVMLTAAWSLQRAQHGEQSFWALIALAAMLGQVGLPGGGFSFGYGSMGSVGANARRGFVPTFPGLPNKGMSIPCAAFADALLHPGQPLDFNGRRITLPDLKLVYWAGGNPFHHAQDLTKVESAWACAETVIVHEPWWTPTARRADIVFPATTAAERNDIGGTSRDPNVVFMAQLVPPQGEARNDRDIFADLAERLGCRAAFDEGLDEEGWLRRMWALSQARGADQGLEVPDYDSFRAQGVWQVPPPETPEVMLDTFRADPDAAPLKTPSGRIELFSETIAGFDLADQPGHPVFHAPAEWLGAARPGEFHLVTNQPETQLHSQLWQTSSGMKGAPAPLRIHPGDAAAQGLEDGARVTLYNRRGKCLATLRLDPGVRPGVLVMPTGAWFDPDPRTGTERNGNPNVLTSDRRTSKLGQACAALSALVRIAPAPTED
ncbi:molybdopterin-dependent oxidoreductase [Pseudooceanicola sp. CBS1P-1]|uniref:Molybdopterin-dependent oxidoreductase n=1 Tax=Pseudooceanicola albus TaxID=2692189 RepID=A0A6L7G5K3_9RHOB|nr:MULTISPECIES: molybdopterin-dependent oxidoreductase [Pseudooceanicola]MBT9385945.1 molybdopterin-dependent oxidoreductase [Pseudooceanicola endophyticus]MXN19634.1 molybdopterin-dependent oxidoreductase [Pseudooceanicola albus]